MKGQVASPEVLKAYYADMERKESLERKLSKRTKGNMFKRKSVKHTVADSSPIPPQPSSASPAPASDSDENIKDMEKLEQAERTDSLPALLASRSLVPEPIKSLPSWYSKEEFTSPAAYRMRYPIHNPVGPRYYRNYHLIPPSELRPAARPPTFFSPSFPPMTAMHQERSEDSSRMASPSRTPSHSPLPTPSSSQTRVGDGANKPRSRKTSQTAHDGVDLLDVSDPWGTNWHHHSPYDVGLGNGPVSAEVEAKSQTRSRRSSMTTRDGRRKTINPSPLSQSTSAIHLQPSMESSSTRVSRKLSKRRTPLWTIMFGGSKKHDTLSLPNSPLEDPDVSHSPQFSEDASQYKRASTITAKPKQERRGSVLGRLAKKFSVTRKPPLMPNDSEHHQDWHHVQNDDAVSEKQQSVVPERQPSPEKVPRRVPPPSVDGIDIVESASTRDPTSLTQGQDRASYVSVEAPPFSIGKLTVANPDAPVSEASTTPVQGAVPLPLQKDELSQEEKATLTPVQSPPVQTPPPVSSSPLSPTIPPSLSLSSLAPSSSAPSPLSPPTSPHTRAPSLDTKSPSPNSVSANGVSSSSRLSMEGKPLPSHAEKKQSSTSSDGHGKRQPPAKKRTPSPDVPPPPPSTTTKPKALPPHTTVPFPPPAPAAPLTSQQDFPYPAYLAAYMAQSDVSDSPYSNSSVLANPGTPYMNDGSIAPSSSAGSEAPPPRVPSKRVSPTKEVGKRPLREPSPGISSVTGRETETFKLVRSASGHVYASTETIKGTAGEHWEVVEQVNGSSGTGLSGRSSQRSNKQERSDKEAKRESRRQEKEKEREREREKERERQKEKERASRSRRQHSVDATRAPPTRKAPRRSNSAESHSRREVPVEIARPDDSRSSRSKEPKKEKRSNRKPVQSASPPVDVNKPQPAPPPPTPGPPASRPLERNKSTSARPTSEVPTAENLNALRAKEMWEMERLYRAKSMTDTNAAASVPFPSSSSPTYGPIGNSHLNGGVHGSSHTSFVVQNGFAHGSSTQIYHSMPNSPPPFVYHSTSSLPSQVDSPLSAHEIFAHPPNPLPEPPRDVRLSQPSELWTQYTSITSAH
ncbi:hypothetical protein Moror_420 [Moniliophthora roreri MCA 2997]|uniref:Uncharacterized protein n=1 Tax=Moniliophthora roreri (strain MCA 2997) TaxID=1381753 RepID=V2Z2A6_MONRO|nr:hypothetical protein Moror_420 [Moniliophthora roreri MCA 2997]